MVFGLFAACIAFVVLGPLAMGREVGRTFLSNLARNLSQSFEMRGNFAHRVESAAQTSIDVGSRLQLLPIEQWQPAAAMSVSVLRRRLAQCGGAKDPAPVERHELERLYSEAAEPTCAICQEEYVEGDYCRVLWPRCRHAYHVECFDRWALGQGAKGRHPVCPVCQAPI